MADDSYKNMVLGFVATCNDQTDGLVRLMEANPALDERERKLMIDHMKRLQRGLAKASDQEIEYFELLTARRTASE